MNQAPIDGGGRRWCRRAVVRSVASVAVVIVIGAGWASPAGAHPDADGHGTITLSGTGDLGGPPTVSGTFFGGSALGIYTEYIRSISLTATPVGPTGGSAISADGCSMVTAGKCGTGTVTFKWQIPALAYNGPYSVNATADHCTVVCIAAGPATVKPKEFRLAADPAAPADLRVESGADRNVGLSWARNGEPDLLYYQVSRKEGGGSFSRIGGDIRQPASGRPAFADTTTSGTGGGEFTYRVVAVRKGASGDDKTTRTSKASGEKAVTVAAPPPPIPPGAPGGEAKTAGSDTNIGGYLAGQAPALPSPKPRFIDLPDTGYEGTLPFGQLPGEDMSEPGEENATPASLETRRLQEFNRGRPLIPIAAGAILLLLAAHLRLFNKRLKQPEGPRQSTSAAAFIATLDASKHAALPIDVEAAVANGGHHREPSGAVTDLPEWRQFRGVTLLPAAPEAGEDEELEDEEEAGEEVWAGPDDEHAEEVGIDLDAEDAEDVDEDAEEEDGDGGVAFFTEVEAWDGDEEADVDEPGGDEDEVVVDDSELVEGPEWGDELELDENQDEVVAELVRASGPVVMPDVEDLEDEADDLADDEAEDLEAEADDLAEDEAEDDDESESAVAINGSHDPLSDFDDFEWSEEAQFAEPEVQVVVGPRG